MRLRKHEVESGFTEKHTKVTKVSDMVLSKILHFVVFVTFGAPGEAWLI
jgi:hypothetical protein